MTLLISISQESYHFLYICANCYIIAKNNSKKRNPTDINNDNINVNC